MSYRPGRQVDAPQAREEEPPWSRKQRKRMRKISRRGRGREDKKDQRELWLKKKERDERMRVTRYQLRRTSG